MIEALLELTHLDFNVQWILSSCFSFPYVLLVNSGRLRSISFVEQKNCLYQINLHIGIINCLMDSGIFLWKKKVI